MWCIGLFDVSPMVSAYRNEQACSDADLRWISLQSLRSSLAFSLPMKRRRKSLEDRVKNLNFGGHFMHVSGMSVEICLKFCHATSRFMQAM